MSKPRVVADRCTDCGGCVGVCPVDAIELDYGRVAVLDHCIECDLCVKACPPGALVRG